MDWISIEEALPKEGQLVCPKRRFLKSTQTLICVVMWEGGLSFISQISQIVLELQWQLERISLG